MEESFYSYETISPGEQVSRDCETGTESLPAGDYSFEVRAYYPKSYSSGTYYNMDQSPVLVEFTIADLRIIWS